MKKTFHLTLHPDGRILFRGKVVSDHSYQSIIAYARNYWRLRRLYGEESCQMYFDGAYREKTGTPSRIA